MITAKSYCHICGSREFTPKLRIQDHTVSKEFFEIIECKRCSFRQTNPIPTPEKLSKYYESEEYISHSETKKGVINSIYHLAQNLNFHLKYTAIKKNVPRGTWVDYGAGSGGFLKYLRDKKKINAKGFEPAEIGRIQGHKKGLNIYSTEEFLQMEHQSIAVITMWHVLEHIFNLEEILNTLHHKLVPNGKLVIAVPNCESHDAQTYKEFWAAYDVPRHLWHFTKNDIRSLAQKTNFSLEKVKGMPLDAYYISLLSEKYKSGSSTKGIVEGFKSNLMARLKKHPWSSQIYILRKNA